MGSPKLHRAFSDRVQSASIPVGEMCMA
jgi:hypothetical protein